MPRVITLDELRARLDGGDPVTLVEALPPMYYEAEHLPGAINIPHDEVDELAPALLPDKDYAEGKAEWIAAGLPVETGVRA